MRIGIIADLHSNLAAFKAVLRHMPRVDALICAGDFVGYGGEPNEVVDLARKKNISAVLGNHDHAAVTRDVSGLSPPAARTVLWTADELTEKNAEYLRGLPKELKISLGDNLIHMVHGSPRRPLTGYVLPETPNRALLNLVQEVGADVIVLGHTHVPMKRMILGKLLINPGGMGQPRDRDPRAGYILLTLGEEPRAEFERVGYDVDQTAKKIKEAGLPIEFATRLYFGW